MFHCTELANSFPCWHAGKEKSLLWFVVTYICYQIAPLQRKHLRIALFELWILRWYPCIQPYGAQQWRFTARPPPRRNKSSQICHLGGLHDARFVQYGRPRIWPDLNSIAFWDWYQRRQLESERLFPHFRKLLASLGFGRYVPLNNLFSPLVHIIMLISQAMSLATKRSIPQDLSGLPFVLPWLPP